MSKILVNALEAEVYEWLVTSISTITSKLHLRKIRHQKIKNPVGLGRDNGLLVRLSLIP